MTHPSKPPLLLPFLLPMDTQTHAHSSLTPPSLSPCKMELWLNDLVDDLQSLSFTSTADINHSTSFGSDATLAASSGPLDTTAKPHTPSSDLCWSAIHRIRSESLAHLLALPDLQFAVRLGSGDIGSVYLAQLKSFDGCLFAAKVMDKKELASRSKEGRARTPFMCAGVLLVSVPDTGAALVDEGCIPVGLSKPTMVALLRWSGHPKAIQKI
jgi:hypothetical protein